MSMVSLRAAVFGYHDTGVSALAALLEHIALRGIFCAYRHDVANVGAFLGA
jgi:hypothetical protein